ncbi:MAG TPA: MlaD family protein [Pseudonocardia sp.]|jgi:phospholipid/cholesterol/gamma-HCH transport system substrate-binding protein|uniref:MlaD family protein n=1 Tax=Pseudonocardia sp. TaxID=60912 RepID=UPI002BC8F355|nr:MlaD family protein [Pseudonocardia sp.]HTF49987.1 MlaD family protein [Pseudonocardia sp.]
MSFTAGRLKALSIVVAFFVLCAAIFLWFLQGTATRVPLLESKGYVSIIKIRDVDNLVPASKIRMAGVVIGEVRSVQQVSDGALVDFAIELHDVAPLHQGVKVMVGNKSLIGDTYLDVVDGNGPAIPDGSTLPDTAAALSTQLDDVIHDLSPPARAALGSMLRSVGTATQGTRDNVNLTAAGLGNLGGQGRTALDALVAQTGDLRALGRNTETLMRALDTQQGQIATLVSNAQRITHAVAGQHESLENSVRMLPGVLRTAQTASGKITELSANLEPVAAGLREASPELNTALVRLRPTTEDLRGLLPSLSGTLDRLPDTLDRLPTLRTDVADLAPDAVDVMRDINPIARYAKPYGPELAAFFANFNAVFKGKDEAGIHYARLMVHINEAAVQSPLKTSAGAVYYNPIPQPGSGSLPGPFEGPYPHVERDSN